MSPLGEKLKIILFQLPPFKFTDDNLNRIKNLKKLLPKNKVNFVFEFRDISWFNDKLYKVMKKNNWCVAGTLITKKDNDITWLGTMPGGLLLPPRTSNITYLRAWIKKYKGAYSINQLKR